MYFTRYCDVEQKPRIRIEDKKTNSVNRDQFYIEFNFQDSIMIHHDIPLEE